MNVDIKNKIEEIEIKISNAAKSASRDANDIKLIAISKTFPQDIIVNALDCGQRIYGENRVQESLQKWPELKEKYPDIELHLVGPLQTNKVKEAVLLFDVIQTLDRMKLASRIIKIADELGKMPKLFIQINTGSEPQKAGLLPKEADKFIETCMNIFKLPIIGLMCIPTYGENPATHFALLKKMADRHGLNELSMGMSADYEMAVELGATYVRVGTGIFGKRG